MKRGQGTCSTFKAFNLTYLHILRAGMVYITMVCARTQVRSRKKLCRRNPPYSILTQNIPRGTCTYQNRPNMVHACTQVCSRGTVPQSYIQANRYPFMHVPIYLSALQDFRPLFNSPQKQTFISCFLPKDLALSQVSTRICFYSKTVFGSAI